MPNLLVGGQKPRKILVGGVPARKVMVGTGTGAVTVWSPMVPMGMNKIGTQSVSNTTFTDLTGFVPRPGFPETVIGNHRLVPGGEGPVWFTGNVRFSTTHQNQRFRVVKTGSGGEIVIAEGVAGTPLSGKVVFDGPNDTLHLQALGYSIANYATVREADTHLQWTLIDGVNPPWRIVKDGPGSLPLGSSTLQPIAGWKADQDYPGNVVTANGIRAASSATVNIRGRVAATPSPSGFVVGIYVNEVQVAIVPGLPGAPAIPVSASNITLQAGDIITLRATANDATPATIEPGEPTFLEVTPA